MSDSLVLKNMSRKSISAIPRITYWRAEYPASIQRQATIDPLAKRHYNGVSVAGRWVGRVQMVTG